MNQFLIDQLADLILSLSKSLGVPDEKILEGIRLAHSNTNFLAVERLHNKVAVVAKGAKHKSAERVRLMEALVYYFNGLSVLMLKALDDGDCVTALKRFGDINKIVGWLEAYWFGENATKEKSIADGGLNSKPEVKKRRLEAYYRFLADAINKDSALMDAADEIYRADHASLSDGEIVKPYHQDKIRKLADSIRKNVSEHERQ